MKKTVIKFMIATFLLPVFLLLLPVGVANEVHGLQHDSNRVAGIQHVDHSNSEHSSSGHKHPAFTHQESDHHPLILDLSTYFNEYLNVDLHSLPKVATDLGDMSADIWLLLPVQYPRFANMHIAAIRSEIESNDPPLFPSVLSVTKRIRI